MQLELNETERQELIRLLTSTHGELSSEIHHTTSRDFREDLRQTRDLVKGLLDRLGAKAQLVQ
jgi:hypothetical protein